MPRSSPPKHVDGGELEVKRVRELAQGERVNAQ